MRRIDPSIYNRSTDGDQALLTAWIEDHGFSVGPTAAGGDFIELIEVSVPHDRVWPEGTVADLKDCWVTVYYKLTIDGQRPLPAEKGFSRKDLIHRCRTIPMVRRPPARVMMLPNDSLLTYQPAWDDAVEEMRALARRLAT